MTERRPGRPLLWVLAGSVAVIAIVAVMWAVASSRGREEPAPPPPSPTEDSADPYRPDVHITPRQHWMNDPQRPFFHDGRWNAYYLYNADYPDGNGTSWYHVTSTDLVHWHDEGVAIEKYRDGLGDIQSGSVVVDTDDTAGFGAGAVIAVATQQADGIQRQSLFVSTDGGSSFTPYEHNPVLDNPGVADFRDPKIVWDDERGQWVMVLAEGDKIGFYTSTDLKAWTYRSGMIRDDLGLLECPDLFRMSVDGDPGRSTWVLGASANGEAEGRTTGYAYWTGTWDGQEYTPDDPTPRWLDDGPDFYAAVTWPDPLSPDARRYAMGWVNNWGYARDLPLRAWQGGAQSLARQLTLVADGDRLRLRATPVLGDTGAGALREQTQVVLAAGGPVVVSTERGARHVRLELAQERLGEATVAVRIGDADAAVRVDISGRDQNVTVDRSGDAAAAGLPDLYRQARSTPLVWHDGRTSIDLIVDGSTLEVFVGDGDGSLTAVVFVPHPDIAVESDTDAVVDGIRVSAVR